MSKDKLPVTSAIRMLRENQADFIEHPYKYEEGGGTEVAAEELGVDEIWSSKPLSWKMIRRRRSSS